METPEHTRSIIQPSLQVELNRTPLDPEAQLESKLLSSYQVHNLETMMADALIELANLRIRDDNWAAYSQAVSFLQGQISCIEHQLSEHAAAQRVRTGM